MTTPSSLPITTSARSPGRPFFDPAGGDHLDGVLAVERGDDIRKMGTTDGWASMRGMSPSRMVAPLDVWAVLDALRASLDGVGMLYGPGAQAAVLDATHGGDRLGVIARTVEQLTNERDFERRAHDDATAEVDRLEHELHAAQVAYDEQRAVAVDVATLRSDLAVVRRYARHLQTAVEHLAVRSWPAGHAKRVLRKAANECALGDRL